MSRLLGIDYGSKQIGIAITDEKKHLAFPFDVIENNRRAIQKILQIIKEKNIKKIILGLPLDIKGRPNPILKDVERFKIRLKKAAKIPIEYENEIFTTREAERIQGRHKKIHASAASLILKSYLQKIKN